MSGGSARRTARKILSWILISVVLAIAVAVAAEWWIEVLKQKNFYADAAARWDRFADRAVAFALSLPVLLATAFSSGLVVGLWADSLPGKKRRGSKPASEDAILEERGRLSRLMDSAIHSADAALKEGTAAAYRHALPGVESTLLTISRYFEIPTPALRSGALGPREGLKRGMDFLVQTAPLLNGGHLDEARLRARSLLAAPEDG